MILFLSEKEYDFQRYLKDCYLYCMTWKLKVFFFLKTKIRVFGTNKPSKFSFKINNQSTEIVTDYRDLSVYFILLVRFVHA